MEEMEKFEKWLIINDCAESTCQSYVQRIKHFLSEVNDEITRESIEDYLLNLKGKFKKKTVNCYRNAISAYLKFKDIYIRLPRQLKLERKVPDAITLKKFEDEVIPMVDATFRFPEKVRAVFYLIFYTGLRPSEIEDLKRENIDMKNLEGSFFSKKKNTWYEFVFNRKVRSILDTYFLLEEQKETAFNLKRSTINKWCDKLKEDFPEIRLRPYLFRHSGATRLRDEGFELDEIKEFLGHDSINSTMCYIKPNKKNFKKKYLERIK